MKINLIRLLLPTFSVFTFEDSLYKIASISVKSLTFECKMKSLTITDATVARKTRKVKVPCIMQRKERNEPHIQPHRCRRDCNYRCVELGGGGELSEFCLPANWPSWSWSIYFLQPFSSSLLPLSTKTIDLFLLAWVDL